MIFNAAPWPHGRQGPELKARTAPRVTSPPLGPAFRYLGLMAAVTVFVDDAVRGDFPRVCARSGQPTDQIVIFRRQMGGISPAMLLLVFLGPVGWVVLVGFALFSRTETLTVRLPYAPQAWRLDRRLRGASLTVGVIGVAALVASFGFVPLGQGTGWLATGLAALAIAAAIEIGRRFDDPRLDLDASRRWVTLTNVHPAFVEATLARVSRYTSH